MNRKERRSQISEFILHSKSFIKEKDSVKEEVLSDGSIKFTIEGFASTEVQDGSGDIVKVEGIDTSRYEINPVLQRGHKRGSENTIGKVTRIDKVAGKGLYIYADVILSPIIEDHKIFIHGLRHGLINGFSIGFNDIETKYDDMLNANVIEKLMLYEISLVDIPDNPLTVRKFIDKIISKGGEVEETKEEEAKTEEAVAEVIPETVPEVVAEVVVETPEVIEEAKEEEKTEEIIEEKPTEEVIEEEKPLPTVEETETPVVAEAEVVDVPEEEEKPAEIVEEIIEEKKPEEVIEEVVETVEEVIETPAEVVVAPVVDEAIAIQPIIEVDLDKSAKIGDLKALQLTEIKPGDMVYFRNIRNDDSIAPTVRPKLEDKPYIGYIFGIKTEGTALVGYGEFKDATPEEPLIYILIYQEVNGTLVPTCNMAVAEFDDILIEGIYDGTMKASYIPQTKELETIQDTPTTQPAGKSEEELNAEEAEKQSGNAMVIKTLEGEKADAEKMLTDMISVNEKLLEKNKTLEAKLTKVRKTKSTTGLTFQGQEELGNSKIGGIVQMMRGA